jgi:hypothetical protein
MQPIQKGGLYTQIESVKVKFPDTGKECVLEVKGDSSNHFFPTFECEGDLVQLRLDWSDLDRNSQPILDADFINPVTRKRRKLRGDRQIAHHTNTISADKRIYEWKFKSYESTFSIMVVWRAEIVESCHASDTCSAEVISAQKDNGP